MEIESCSQKVISRAVEPKFLGTEKECDDFFQKKDSFFCHFHFPNSNGEITIYGQLGNEGNGQVIKEARFFTNVKGAPLAFLDALVELSHKRDFHSLPLLRMKEIEAFLRDKNSQPSFPDEGISLFRYYEVIHAFQQSIGKKNAYSQNMEACGEERTPPNIEEYKPHSFLLFDHEKLGEFRDLNEELKRRIVGDVLSYHVRPLLQRDGGDVECVHVLDNLIVVVFHGSCGTCGMSLTTTMDFIKKVLRNELYDSSIDIITDS
ncbi:MAG: NifU family protein [Bacteriovoracia bacterium]